MPDEDKNCSDLLEGMTSRENDQKMRGFRKIFQGY